MKKSLLFTFLFSFLCVVLQAQYNTIVAKDGTGNYTALQDAINAAPTNSATPYVIFIKNGRYYEKITIPSNKPNIQLIGESVANVVVTYDDYAGKPITGGGTLGTQNSASVTINANDFTAVNITFENGFKYDSAVSAGITGTQAVAVVVNADRAAFKNCRFIGMQDTLYTKGSGTPRHYFYKCYIDGIVDFIFGSSVAIFDSCVVYPKSRTTTGNSYITAANTTIGQAYGYWFKDCNIPNNTGNTSYFLGRPWNNATSGVTAANKTVYTNCKMSSSVNPLGWSTWDAGTNTNVITYAEYQSKKFDGSLVDVSNRVSWSKQFTNADTVGYNILNVLNGWNPCSVRTDFCTTPTTELAVSNFKGIKTGANTNFTWNISWALTGITYELYRSIDNKASFQLLSSTTAANDTSINFNSTDAVPPSCSSYFYFIKSSKAGYTTTYTDTIEISSIPTINTTANSLTNFLQGSTAPSASQTFTVNANNLVNNVTITTPANFEISLDNSAWINSSSSITLTPTTGNIANTVIYVRLNAPTANTYSGNITLTTTCSAQTIIKTIAVSGTTQSTPLETYGVLQQWELTANSLDNPLVRDSIEPTVPVFSKLYLSNGTQVATIPAYSTQFGQAFGASTNGDGSWGTAIGGPGSNLNRTYYEEFTVKPRVYPPPPCCSSGVGSQYVNVDSILLTTAFYNTSSGIKLAVAYSKSNFTSDSGNVTGGRDGAGLTLASSANGAFTTPIILTNQTSGPSAQYALALNAGIGVGVGSGESLKIRLYYACGSGNPGRYAMLKDVKIKGWIVYLLPLKLIDFSVNRNGKNQIETYWTTANEVNVSYYNIERSINGKEFEIVGKVKATNKTLNEYRYTDESFSVNGFHSTVFYRIAGVDNDGKMTYSEVKKLIVNNTQAISIYPNPAKGLCNVVLNNINNNAKMIVTNIIGTTIITKNLTAGNNVIDVSSFTKGIYFVNVTTTNNVVTQKLIVE